MSGAAFFTVATVPAAVEESTPTLVSQLCSSTGALGGLRRELGLLARDAGHHDHDDEDADGGDGEQDECGGECSGHVPVEHADDGHRHDRDDEGAHHRPDDRVCLGDEPDQADDEREDADQQP